jgi:hypothetical protein
MRKYKNGMTNFDTYHADIEDHNSVIDVLDQLIKKAVEFKSFLEKRDKDEINKIDPIHYNFIIAVPNLDHDSMIVGSFGHLGAVAKTVCHAIEDIGISSMFVRAEADLLLDKHFTPDDEDEDVIPTPFDVDKSFNTQNNET